MTRVFFVRHGHCSPPVNAEHPDPGLSPRGFRQAQEAAERLSASVERPALLSSPARRARETATVLARRLGLESGTDADLVEIRGAGAADPVSRERMSQRWRSGDRTAGHPGGETLGEALDRFAAVLHRLALAIPDGDLILVSHGAFMALGLLHLCDHDLDPMTAAGLVHCATPVLQVYRRPAAKLGRVDLWNPTQVDTPAWVAGRPVS